MDKGLLYSIGNINNQPRFDLKASIIPKRIELISIHVNTRLCKFYDTFQETIVLC